MISRVRGVLTRANSEAMENSEDEPLPPGVPSWPNYAHGTLSHYALTSEAIPNVKPTMHQEQIDPSNSNLAQNTRLDDATVTVSNNTASNYYNGSRDIDIAAQDAVLREQVCCYLLCKVLHCCFGLFEIVEKCGCNCCCADIVDRLLSSCYRFSFGYFSFDCSGCFGFVFIDRKLRCKMS